MDGLSNWSPRRTDTDRTTAPAGVGRRDVLRGGAMAAVLGIAGCIEGDIGDANLGSDPDEEPDDGPNDDSDESEDLEDDLLAVVGDYVDAAAAEDTDAMADVVHESSPLNPARWEEEGWEFQGDDYEGVGDVDAESVTEDASIDDVYELEGAEFWFQEVDLETEIGSEEIALLEVTSDELEADDLGVWVLVTEADEWRVFFVGTDGETPDDPESTFEEPIEDGDDDVVAEIDWEFEQGDGSDPALDGDGEWAQVVLTDSPGIDAETVRIESTVAGSEFEFYSDAENGSATSWAGSWANVRLDPAGDQVVVTAIDDGTETVVHRERYEP